ncbi:MAG: ABC transporter substrate-binding protein [Acetobacteraceae bacterium]|nr:ABC transporter substrate-binding protein [Acetobacteraceae bacterium]
MNTRWKMVAALGLGLSLLGAATPAQTLRIGISSDPDILDPTLSRSVAGRQVFTAMCDKLVDIDAKLNFVPQLATAWKWSDDGRALTLSLRPGVTFHDGTALDAAAVQASLERHLRMAGSTRKAELGPVAAIDAMGPLEVRITMSSVFAPLVAALSDRAGMMMSTRTAAQTGEAFAAAPGCAGPYKFVRRIAQDRIELERFKEHWDAGRFHFDKVIYQPITDTTIRAANLRAGSLEIIEAVNPTDVAAMAADKRVKLHMSTGLVSGYIAINVGNGRRSEGKLGRGKLVREALDAAIDRQILNQVAFNGAYIPGNQSVQPESPFYSANVPVPPRDLARAKALLKQAGLDQVKMQMSVPNTTEFRQAAEVIQAMAREAGIDIELTVVEVATLLKQWTDGDFESLIILWSGRTDIDANLYNFNACGMALNGGRYCNPEVDRLLNEGRGTTDFAKRKIAYDAAAKIYLDDRPYIYLWNGRLIAGTSARLDGLIMVPDGMLRLRDLRLRDN